MFKTLYPSCDVLALLNHDSLMNNIKDRLLEDI